MTDDTPTDEQHATDDSRAAPEACADSLADVAVPFDTTDPDAPLDDLTPVADALADATVVALGEATHGSREVFQCKHRLVRALVEDHGLRLLALEANVSETRALDDYVYAGEGDAADALDGIYFWTWNTEELLALVEWLRGFNAGRPPDDRVRVFGVDVQFTAGAAERLGEFFGAVDPDALAGHGKARSLLAENGLDPWIATGERDDRDPSVLAAHLDRVESFVDDLGRRLDERGAEYAEGTAERRVELAREHLRAVEWTLELKRTELEEKPEATGPVRDRAMADTLSRTRERSAHDQVAFWAHDEHVKREPDLGPAETPSATGEYLAREYGDDYYALGFDVGGGSFQAIAETADGEYELGEHSFGPPPSGAATRLFRAVGAERFFVDLETATADPALADYFARERPVRSVGAVYYGPDATDRHHDSYVLPAAFDGLVYLGETTRARPVE